MWDREINKGVHYQSTGVDPHSVMRLIDEGYAATRREPQVKKKETFAPSSVGYGHGTCPRYWYLAFEGKYVFDESATDDMALAAMSNGTYFHDRFGKILEGSGAVVSLEQELLMEDPPIRGFIDAIIQVDGDEVVVENKSARSEVFQIRVNSMKPAPYHLYQLLIYLKGLGKTKGVIIYENKNDQSVLVIPVTMDTVNEQIIEDAFAWMREVRSNWETSEEDSNLPTRPWTRKNKNCKGCPLFDECWNNLPDGNVKLLPMEVVKL
jgi:CRISPR/Cas system-associated exonuclease Cas4 (RecB family)